MAANDLQEGYHSFYKPGQELTDTDYEVMLRAWRRQLNAAGELGELAVATDDRLYLEQVSAPANY